MNSPIIEKKKRGRKKQNIILTADEVSEIKPVPKKRGRKPKGGKIIQQSTNILIKDKDSEPNIILHLKCFIDDINEDTDYSLKYDPNLENIKSFNFDNMETNKLLINNKGKDNHLTDYKVNSNSIIHEDTENSDNNDNKNSKNELWDKLNKLKMDLHKNNISDKRSACFWCTYDFDNPPIFIPKNEFKNNYQVYGCFCSPECSSAYLMNEKIDSSVKFERYQLLNHVYGKIYNYNKNIKPAPNPYYLLDKYYGTLTIKEYRDLFKNDQLLIVVDKPLTHIFPELYEDNSDFILNQRTIPTNATYKLKRKGTIQKKTSVHDDLICKN